jgi:hypothetical protein
MCGTSVLRVRDSINFVSSKFLLNLAGRNAPTFGLAYHFEQTADNLATFGFELIRSLISQVAALLGIVEPDNRFTGFADSIAQLAGEVLFIRALKPCLCNVGANGPRRTADLIRQRVFFLPAASLSRPRRFSCSLQKHVDTPAIP